GGEAAGSRISAGEPPARVGQEAVPVWDARDQAALLREPAEGDTESVSDVRRHRRATIARAYRNPGSPLRTRTGTQRSVAATQLRRRGGRRQTSADNPECYGRD